VGSEVWYRKWRPRTFAEVCGQEHVTRTLRNAVAQGRVAHAYLLCGPRGTGKTSTARVLAKAVNCAAPRDGEPCNACESCRAVNEGRALDLVEMDAASNRGIDDIRNLRDRVGYHPSTGAYRVYLIDEVHELTPQAFDALLKTLEEPPPHVIFVLATTDVHRVPPTIISRCQRFDLTRIRHADIVARLRFIAEQEGVRAEPGALDVIARAAGGGLRDAVNLLEQVVATFGPEVSEDQVRATLGLVADERARALALAAARGDLSGGLAIIGTVQEDGVELRQFNREVVAHLRALLLLKSGAEAGLDGFTAEARAELRAAAMELDVRRILRALKAFSGADFRGEWQPALPLELALAEATLAAEADAVRTGSATPFGAGGTTGSDGMAPRRAEVPSRPWRPSAALASPPDPSAPSEEANAVVTGLHEPAHAAPRATGPITLEEARARFRAIRDACSANVQARALLNSGCDIVAVNEHVITFGFRYDLLLSKAQPGTPVHRALVAAVEQVLGRRLDVQCIHVPDVTDRLRAQPPRSSHLVDEARKLGLTPIERTSGA
jgi:DNA polymerase-3 subunit gamma/tau